MDEEKLRNGKIILCYYCGENEKNQVKGGYYWCEKCNPVISENSWTGIETVDFTKYGLGHVSKKRIEEMKRRVILPDEHPGGTGSYYVGRRGENGKIQERVPRYQD